MIHTKKNVTPRVIALFFALLMVISALPLTVLAAKDEETAQKGVRIEEEYITNDDGVYCTTGFLVYCDDMTPTALKYKIVDTRDEDKVISDSKWVVVTPLTKEEGTQEESSTGADTDGNQQVQEQPDEPDYLVDFRMADGEKMPEFLFASTLGKMASQDKTTQYAIAPFYAVYFYVETEENAGKDPIWTKALEATDGYVFTLDRPQRVAIKLEQEEAPENENGTKTSKTKFKPSSSGTLSVYYYVPKTVRDLLSSLEENKAELLKRYGYSDLTVSVRYTLGSEKALTDQQVEKASYLEFPLTAEQAGNVVMHKFSFDDEAFRNCYPQKTFNSYEIGGEKIEGSTETTPRTTVYDIDKTKTTLGVRLSFVLNATPKPDANGAVGEATVIHSKMTDAFYCGETNTMLSAPKKLDAPTVTVGEYDKSTQKLPVSVSIADGARDAAVWLACLYNREVKIPIEISINGEEWHEAVVNDWYTSGSYMSGGTHTLDLSGEAMTEYAYIRIRGKLILDTNGESDLESAWSASASFDMRPEKVVTAPGTTEPISYYTETTVDVVEKKATCRLCGFCPSPYGICLFLWIGAVLLIAVLVVLVILMIPKRKQCPRCDTKCDRNAPVCPECGFRFVGMMPEIEEDEPKRPVVTNKKAARIAEDDRAWEEVFGVTPAAPEKKAPAIEIPTPVAEAPKTATPAEDIAPVSTPREEAIVLPSVTPAFMAELKRKMRETKAGNPQAYTAEELAYIKLLREKTAQDKRLAEAKAAAEKAAAEKATIEAAARVIAEEAAVVEEAEAAPAPTETVEKPLPEKKLSAEQLARIRALRASQMRSAAQVKPMAKNEPLPELRRAHSKPIEVKCPHCAAPNVEGSAVCRVCKAPLKK